MHIIYNRGIIHFKLLVILSVKALGVIRVLLLNVHKKRDL